MAQRAAATFKPVSLEMGGKNAQIVLDDANLELALDGALWGAFGTTGQRCTATSRILLQKGIAAEVHRRVRRPREGPENRQRPRRVRAGRPAGQQEPDRNLREVRRDRERAKAASSSAAATRSPRAITPRARSSSRPSSAESRPPCASPAKKSSARSSPLIEFDTFEQGIEIANSIDYGLSSALYTKDLNRAFAAIRDLEAGITYINAPTIGAEVHLPFGGVKHTGNGHREGNGAIDFFTTWKAVYVDYTDKLQRAQIDNAE